MIDIVKEKTVMRGTSPTRILTLEINLAEVGETSREMSVDDFKKHLGSYLYNKVSSVAKCKND